MFYMASNNGDCLVDVSPSIKQELLENVNVEADESPTASGLPSDREAETQMPSIRRDENLFINVSIEQESLDRLAILLKAKLESKHHRSLVHVYSHSFRGSDALLWLLGNSVCSDMNAAKQIMYQILRRRLILRVDGTKPVLNGTVRYLQPSLASKRSRKLLKKNQEVLQKFSAKKLFAFNIKAFAKYKLCVRIVQGDKLQCSRSDETSGSSPRKKISPLARVWLGDSAYSTSVGNNTNNPVWNETLCFYFDDSDRHHQELCLKVFDYRSVGASVLVGTVYVPTDTILQACGVLDIESVDIDSSFSSKWKSWHDLVAPSSPDKSETKGDIGRIELELSLIPNIRDDPSETVHRECRRFSLRNRDQDTPVESCDIKACQMPFHAMTSDSAFENLPRKRKSLDSNSGATTHWLETRSLSLPSGCSAGVDESPLEINDEIRKSAPKMEDARVPNVTFFELIVSEMSLRAVGDFQAGAQVWIELLVCTPFKTTHIKRKLAKKNGKSVCVYIVDKCCSDSFIWSNDESRLVSSSPLRVCIPEDVLANSIAEFRVICKKDGLSSTTYSKGKLYLGKLPLRPGESLRSEKLGDNVNRPEYFDSESALPVAHRSSFFKDSDGPSDDSDRYVIVLLKQAVFKRNMKIMCGELLVEATLKPKIVEKIDDLDLGTESLEDLLKCVIEPPGAVVQPIDLPPAMKTVHVDETLDVSVAVLTKLLLSHGSSFRRSHWKSQGITDVEVEPWTDLSIDSISSSSISRGSSAKSFLSDSSRSSQPVLNEISLQESDSQKNFDFAGLEVGGYAARTVKFNISAGSFTGPALCIETQVIYCINPGGFVFVNACRIPSVPFGEKFFSTQQFAVVRLKDSKCRLRISGDVEWIDGGPPIFLKKIISRATVDGQKGGSLALLQSLNSWIPKITETKAPQEQLLPPCKDEKAHTLNIDQLGTRPIWQTLIQWLLLPVSLVFLLSYFARDSALHLFII